MDAFPGLEDEALVGGEVEARAEGDEVILPHVARERGEQQRDAGGGEAEREGPPGGVREGGRDGR